MRHVLLINQNRDVDVHFTQHTFIFVHFRSAVSLNNIIMIHIRGIKSGYGRCPRSKKVYVSLCFEIDPYYVNGPKRLGSFFENKPKLKNNRARCNFSVSCNGDI